MQKIVSHTLVKNGMPFIVPVLEQVLPYMNRCLVAISASSNDGTIEAINKLADKNGKIKISYENVRHPSELTRERQRQLEESYEDWVLFLDDDDWWPVGSLKAIESHLEDNVDGFSINPFQVVSEALYDVSWRNKFFTKFFRNQPGVHYEHPWPRDLIYKDKDVLYWKVNPRVPKLPVRFFHLSYIKNHSFRGEEWASKYKITPKELISYPEEVKDEVRRIFTIRDQ